MSSFNRFSFLLYQTCLDYIMQMCLKHVDLPLDYGGPLARTGQTHTVYCVFQQVKQDLIKQGLF